MLLPAIDHASDGVKAVRNKDAAKAQFSCFAGPTLPGSINATLGSPFCSPIIWRGGLAPCGLSLAYIDRLTEETAVAEPAHVTARRIMRDVSKQYNVSEFEIKSDRRQARIVIARFHAAYLLHKHLPWSIVHIGRFLGRRDHSSIIYAVDTHCKRNGLSEIMKYGEGGRYVGI